MNNRTLSIALAFILPFTVAAAPGENVDHPWHRGDRIERLSKELNLSAEQKAKLEAIFKERKEKFKAFREEVRKSIEALLTKEQLAKFEELKKQRHEKWLQKPGEAKKSPEQPQS